jgi:hypothetical protein
MLVNFECLRAFDVALRETDRETIFNFVKEVEAARGAFLSKVDKADAVVLD